MKTYHVVKGSVTDPEVWGGLAKVGDPEWQFSDGPPGERGASSDFLSLDAGLRALAPAIFILAEPLAKTRVFVATYEHKYGADSRVFTTAGAAQAWKDEIADQWWEREFPGRKKPETAVGDRYFDDIEGEYFEITPTDLED